MEPGLGGRADQVTSPAARAAWGAGTGRRPFPGVA